MIQLEETPTDGPNMGHADAVTDLQSYYALKRLISRRSLLFATPLAVMLAVRVPALGLDLMLGVACGIANILLIMRANERLLDGRGSLRTHAMSGLLRVVLFGAAPVATAALGPWWGILVYFAGFFTPLMLYVIELNRRYQRGRT